MDPMLLKRLGDEHLEDLRRSAARHRLAVPRAVPAWRRLSGYAFVHVGLRLLRDPAPPRPLGGTSVSPPSVDRG